jgi:FkbM family methyltransferase
MLVSFEKLLPYLNKNTVKGVIHVGAHVCEEMYYYKTFLQIQDTNIFWVEGNPETYNIAKRRYPNSKIFHGLCTDKTGDVIDFNITTNLNNNNSSDSSSIYKLGTHLKHHPFVIPNKTIVLSSITLDDLLKNEDTKNVNMLNLDVQGCELLVCKGATKILEQIDYIYTEINNEHLYENCALVGDMDEYLSKYNFKRVLTEWTEYQWGDALYVKVK